MKGLKEARPKLIKEKQKQQIWFNEDQQTDLVLLIVTNMVPLQLCS